jgi:hypothetical protein
VSRREGIGSRQVLWLLLLGFTMIRLGLVYAVWHTEPDGISPVSLKLPEWDFTNLWAGGRLALEHHLSALFDRDAFNAWLREQFSPRIAGEEWSYPPSMLLLGAPLGLLPITWAYVIWTAATMAALWAAIRLPGLPVTVGLMAVLGPATITNLALGQNGALSAALLVGGLMVLPTRPILAGVLIGLLTMKPQLGLLLPVGLLASRNWRAIAAAALTTATLVIVTAALFGWGSWVAFLTVTQPMMREIMEAPYGAGYQVHGITVFLLARALGAGINVAYWVQAVAALAAACLCWLAWRRNDVDQSSRVALTVVLGLLATPYAWSYDMVAYGAAVAMLIAQQRWRLSPALLSAWVAPALVEGFTRAVLPLTPLLIALAAWVAWRSLPRRLELV